MIIIPNSAADITLVQWADFQIENAKYAESGSFDDLLNAVASFYSEADHKDLSELQFGDITDEVVLGEEPTLFALYTYIAKLLVEYQPELITLPFTVKWKGEEYILSAADTMLLIGCQPITVGEAVTLLELTRVSGEGVEALYNLTISHLAVLLRKKDEMLPLLIGDRERFIDNRKQLWADAPMTIGLQVQQYFNALIATILQRFPPSNVKPTKEGQEAWDRSGWNSIVANHNAPLNETLQMPLEGLLYTLNYKH